jgi:FkbM family methyltransferase
MKSYAQYEEDLFLMSYFNDNKKHYGVEVGASDGVFVSPTKLLEENGWEILCIEPNPISFMDLQKNRKHCLQYAVGNENMDNVTFTVFNLDRDENYQDAISSLNPDQRLIDEHIGFDLLINSYPENVNVRTLDFCINQWLNILGISKDDFKLDFVSIDTEGTEMDVIEGFDIEYWDPKLVLIENNFNEERYRVKMMERGYKLINIFGINDLYVKN